MIAVGSVNRHGAVWNYSCRGSELDVVAPSGDYRLQGDVYTLDRMGNNGYEAGNYTTRFGGTSAACPQVAGIATLMLSENPNLTSQQVTDIIENTARKVGSYGYTTTSDRPICIHSVHCLPKRFR